MSTIFAHIDPSELPEAWLNALRLRPGQKVTVTIEPDQAVDNRFDLAAFKAGMEELKKLPVLDDRTPDEIIGYDDNGLPA